MTEALRHRRPRPLGAADGTPAGAPAGEGVAGALIEPERLAEWFPTTVAPELRVGGAVEFGFGPPAPSPTSTGRA